MPFELFDYLNDNNENEFKEWSENLQKKELAKLNQKLDLLELHGNGLAPNLLSDTSVSGIKKIKVRGSVQLRPLLCYGPINNDSEFTLLMGAKEIGDKWSPQNAPDIALKKKLEVIKDPIKKRKKHEKVGKTSGS